MARCTQLIKSDGRIWEQTPRCIVTTTVNTGERKIKKGKDFKNVSKSKVQRNWTVNLIRGNSGR